MRERLFELGNEACGVVVSLLLPHLPLALPNIYHSSSMDVNGRIGDVKVGVTDGHTLLRHYRFLRWSRPVLQFFTDRWELQSSTLG